MTPKQREAAERLMEQMGNDHRGYDPDFNEAAAILRELLAEPVQEPVAWHVCSVNSDGSLSLEFAASWEESAHEHINDAINEYDIDGATSWVVRPVYAAPQQPMHCPKDGGECGAGGYCRPEPQQRKPLSDEQVRQIVVDASTSWAFKRDGSTSMRIARAIERAHGIGEPT